MKTELLTVNSENPGKSPRAIEKAVELLKKGETVAIPTETVYGLAADAKNAGAVKKIFKAKGRPQDNPLIVHISDYSELYEIAEDIPQIALSLAEEYWPGPLTMIFKKKSVIPDVTSGGLDTVAVRMPSHPVIREIIRQGKILIAAPSANISGRPSGTNAADVFSDFNGLIPLVLDGGECSIGVESTVISFATETPTLFRPGFITAEELEEKLGKIEVSPAVFGELKSGEKASSPGMKYKHYSPACDVYLIKGSREKYIKYVLEHNENGVYALCFDDEKPIENSISYGGKDNYAEQAKNIFAMLRRLDREGAKKVFVHCPKTDGIALATYNRLIRAAAFKIIEL
ncbi:MAG: L-threonylcarbamoyladenylate synthase [Acutalibacteraceae bacterium]